MEPKVRRPPWWEQVRCCIGLCGVFIVFVEGDTLYGMFLLYGGDSDFFEVGTNYFFRIATDVEKADKSRSHKIAAYVTQWPGNE